MGSAVFRKASVSPRFSTLPRSGGRAAGAEPAAGATLPPSAGCTSVWKGRWDKVTPALYDETHATELDAAGFTPLLCILLSSGASLTQQICALHTSLHLEFKTFLVKL